MFVSKAFFLWLLFTLFGSASVSWSLTIDNYSAAKNDRFANDASFILGDQNLSGIARASNNAWLVMISPNTFLCAAHYTPAVGDTIRFYRENDVNGASITRVAASTRQKVGASDLYIGTLDAPLPEGYAYYDYADEIVTDSTEWTATHRNRLLFHFGQSPGNYPPEQDIGVGFNLADVWVGLHTIDGSTAYVFAAIYEASGDPDYQKYESKVVGSDSGAPVFYKTDTGDLRVLGITWGTATWGKGDTGSLFTYVGSYADSVSRFVATNGLGYEPLAPSGFQAQRIGANQDVELRWQDLSSVETAYSIERKTSPNDSWTPLATLPADATRYEDAGAPPGELYYRLKALNKSVAGNSVEYVLAAP